MTPVVQAGGIEDPSDRLFAGVAFSEVPLNIPPTAWLPTVHDINGDHVAVAFVETGSYHWQWQFGENLEMEGLFEFPSVLYPMFGGGRRLTSKTFAYGPRPFTHFWSESSSLDADHTRVNFLADIQPVLSRTWFEAQDQDGIIGCLDALQDGDKSIALTWDRAPTSDYVVRILKPQLIQFVDGLPIQGRNVSPIISLFV